MLRIEPTLSEREINALKPKPSPQDSEHLRGETKLGL